jgi:hypothetical protein
MPPVQNLFPVLMVAFFTVLSGIGDTYGFSHASDMWEEGKLVWAEMLKSASGFLVGFVTYWFAVRFLREMGVVATEVQTLFWFGVTIFGIALLSGKFFTWHRIDQIVALAVLLGIGWLLFHAGA